MKNSYRLTVISISVALCVVLDYLKTFLPFLNMPMGGSINIALIPLVTISYVYSYKEGMITGFLWWLVSSLLGLNNYILNVGQYLLDYILPSIIPGLSSLLCLKIKNDKLKIMSGITLAMLLRSFVLVLSGAYFWPGEFAKGSVAAWMGSLSYNLPYNLLTCVMLCIVVPVLYKRIGKIVIR